MSNKTQVTKEELDISGIHFELINKFKLSGVARWWDKNGGLLWEYHYKNGHTTGRIGGVDENETIRWEHHYENGVHNGVCMGLDENGAIRWEHHYENGVRIK